MTLVNPLAGVVTSSYDVARRHPLLKNPDGTKRIVPHYGTDIGGRPRDGRAHPIHAAAAGRVLAVRSEWPAGRAYLARLTGNYVVIEHDPINGRTFRTYYGHLATVTVDPGQDVAAGQVIGTQGATGNVDGAHLHLEVWVGGQTVDPAPFFASRGVLLGAGPTRPLEDVMAKLDPEDYREIAAHVWAHRIAGSNRPAGEVIDKTNHATGRLDALRNKLFRKVLPK